jgi:hypothetical protein
MKWLVTSTAARDLHHGVLEFELVAETVLQVEDREVITRFLAAGLRVY